MVHMAYKRIAHYNSSACPWLIGFKNLLFSSLHYARSDQIEGERRVLMSSQHKAVAEIPLALHGAVDPNAAN